MNVKGVFQIIQLVIPAIQTAEDFIRGLGKGGEKREAVLGNLAKQLMDLKREINETVGIDYKSFKWVKFALSYPEFLAKVGKLVDDIVDLANFLQSFDDKPDVEVVPPPVN